MWDGDYGRTEKDFYYDPQKKEGYGEEYQEEPPVSDERLDEIYEAVKKYIAEMFEKQIPDDVKEELAKNETYYCKYHDPDWRHPLLYLLNWINDDTNKCSDDVLEAIGVTEEEIERVESMYWF